MSLKISEAKKSFRINKKTIIAVILVLAALATVISIVILITLNPPETDDVGG